MQYLSQLTPHFSSADAALVSDAIERYVAQGFPEDQALNFAIAEGPGIIASPDPWAHFESVAREGYGFQPHIIQAGMEALPSSSGIT